MARLTGNFRYVKRTPLLGLPTVVLQVEEISLVNLPGLGIENEEIPRWRDAKWEDLDDQSFGSGSFRPINS